ncbi:uncharacterized protein STEHIDRAFT_111107 [Stereum hirsutum FP-91666 SS1]|uniref:uncharacterized protein n=1 Tax=Stereum hirsutum (strain FP-91666) TaxID=721885 RepID=UPI000440BFAE|nr:uncharacterized protein STEHIDRAFT_111107 [Stereum hirsutum FP-91666 SS1]EIM86648.1 hypothetical protein STEHIDRAFT_111107 [Stereum hirsutum FP-91666 SS1]
MQIIAKLSIRRISDADRDEQGGISQRGDRSHDIKNLSQANIRMSSTPLPDAKLFDETDYTACDLCSTGVRGLGICVTMFLILVHGNGGDHLGPAAKLCRSKRRVVNRNIGEG